MVAIDNKAQREVSIIRVQFPYSPFGAVEELVYSTVRLKEDRRLTVILFVGSSPTGTIFKVYETLINF